MDEPNDSGVQQKRYTRSECAKLSVSVFIVGTVVMMMVTIATYSFSGHSMTSRNWRDVIGAATIVLPYLVALAVMVGVGVYDIHQLSPVKSWQNSAAKVLLIPAMIFGLWCMVMLVFPACLLTFLSMVFKRNSSALFEDYGFSLFLTAILFALVISAGIFNPREEFATFITVQGTPVVCAVWVYQQIERWNERGMLADPPVNPLQFSLAGLLMFVVAIGAYTTTAVWLFRELDLKF